jgi:hypothetical protein
MLVVALAGLMSAPAAQEVDPVRAEAYFQEARQICERDGGRLWGISLCGPMVIADAATRTFATSQPAPDATWPATLGIVNAPITWGGERWSAYVWSLLPVDDPQARRRILIHELHHRIQPQLGQVIAGQPNDHLDTLEGRYWLQLEWRALAQALPASNRGAADAVRDALAFRTARRAEFPGAAANERADEIREGLAQYTGTVLAAASPAEAATDAIRQLGLYAENPTFVSTFGYPSGAAYGVLLDRWSPGWTHRFKTTDDLGTLLMTAAGIEPADDVTAAAGRYGGAALRAAEERRAKEREARVADLRKRFVDGPVLVVPRGRQASIKTTGITPIPGEGRVIFEYRTEAEWGTLEAFGVLVSTDGRLRLPLPYRLENGVMVGDNWTLTLAPDWKTAAGPRPGDLAVVRRESRSTK